MKKRLQLATICVVAIIVALVVCLQSNSKKDLRADFMAQNLEALATSEYWGLWDSWRFTDSGKMCSTEGYYGHWMECKKVRSFEVGHCRESEGRCVVYITHI